MPVDRGSAAHFRRAAGVRDALEDSTVGDGRESLIGLTRDELAASPSWSVGVPADRARMRAKQLWHWIYHRGATEFDAMTTIGGAGCARRSPSATRSTRPETVTAQHSADGTRKWLLRFADGREVETVYIPEEDRGALCISSQVGCTLSCSFCHTGTQRHGAQSGGRRDRHAIPRGPRRLRRVAVAARAAGCCRTS